MPRKPSLTCSMCTKPMAKTAGSLPQGQATCLDCRRSRRVLGREDCLRCGKALTPQQRRSQGTFCSTRCVYAYLGPGELRGTSRGRDYKRRRAMGYWRPARDGWMPYGPPRRQVVTLRVYPDGSSDIRCPFCWEGTDGWCVACAVEITVTGRVGAFASL